MEPWLFLLASLALLSFCRGQDWEAPDFCHQQKCPQYKLVEKHQDFEERFYAASDWITTKVESTGTTDFLTARSRLQDYCKKHSDAGRKFPDDTWPVLITVTDGHDFSLSWFVPPGTEKPENTDPSVTLTTRPEGTVYVRVFGDAPSIENGQKNMEILRDALVKGCADLLTYTGAAYESYFSFTHHSEIWIYADDIKKSKCS